MTCVNICNEIWFSQKSAGIAGNLRASLKAGHVRFPGHDNCWLAVHNFLEKNTGVRTSGLLGRRSATNARLRGAARRDMQAADLLLRKKRLSGVTVSCHPLTSACFILSAISFRECSIVSSHIRKNGMKWKMKWNEMKWNFFHHFGFHLSSGFGRWNEREWNEMRYFSFHPVSFASY